MNDLLKKHRKLLWLCLCVLLTLAALFCLWRIHSLKSALDAQRFVRISRYELVNLDMVRKFDFTLGGTLRLELAGGMETWASRRCIPAIRARLKGKE